MVFKKYFNNTGYVWIFYKAPIGIKGKISYFRVCLKVFYCIVIPKGYFQDMCNSILRGVFFFYFFFSFQHVQNMISLFPGFYWCYWQATFQFNICLCAIKKINKSFHCAFEELQFHHDAPSCGFIWISFS